MIVENLPTLKMNKMSQEQYENELSTDNLNTSELYLTPVKDYVVEQGTKSTAHGTWTYCKWASGVYECWGRLTSPIKTVVSGFGSKTNVSTCWGTTPFPITFPEIPVVTYDHIGNNAYEFSGKTQANSTEFYWYLLSNATYVVGNTVTINAHVTGRWK